MRSNCGRFGVLSHQAEGLHQSLFELIQGDGLQIRPLRQERFDDGFDDDGGIRAAGTRLHLDGFRGGIGRSGSGRLGTLTQPTQAEFRESSPLPCCTTTTFRQLWHRPESRCRDGVIDVLPSPSLAGALPQWRDTRGTDTRANNRDAADIRARQPRDEQGRWRGYDLTTLTTSTTRRPRRHRSRRGWHDEADSSMQWRGCLWTSGEALLRFQEFRSRKRRQGRKRWGQKKVGQKKVGRKRWAEKGVEKGAEKGGRKRCQEPLMGKQAVNGS